MMIRQRRAMLRLNTAVGRRQHQPRARRHGPMRVAEEEQEEQAEDDEDEMWGFDPLDGEV